VHREFCTLLDSNYLFKAVAMHRSLQRHCPSFHLTVFCFDELAEEMFAKLELPNLSTVPLAGLEDFDSELLAVKEDRTPVEYCWTSTPALPLYMFDARPELDEVTYLDADLLFFADPEPLFEEMGDDSVLITPHRYSERYKGFEESGIYNVQFLTFRRDARSLECLQWWHDRCIEWCYYRLEDGKLGDQKYLDDWPERFQGIHVLRHIGGGLGPWNINQYEVRRDGERVWVDDTELVFYHYHRVKMLGAGGYDWNPPGYSISEHEFEVVYKPYMAALDEAQETVRAASRGFKAGIVPPSDLRDRLGRARIAAGGWTQRNLPAVWRLRESMNRW
jgi:hypothetical protein